MNKILLLGIALLFNNSLLADSGCFLVKENNKIIKQEGDCKTRHLARHSKLLLV
jgi:hypothetical protein